MLTAVFSIASFRVSVKPMEACGHNGDSMCKYRQGLAHEGVRDDDFEGFWTLPRNDGTPAVTISQSAS
jgi:hypothetical protein